MSVPRADHTAELLVGIRAGDAAALERFHRGWYERLVREATAMTRRDIDFALDVVQDALVRLIDRPPAVGCEAHLAAWMRRVMFSCAIDRIRSDARRVRREIKGWRGEGGARDPAEVAGGGEELRWLTAQLEGLDAEDRMLVEMRVGGGLSLGVLGEQGGRSEGSVQGRVRRILRGLQERAKELFQ